jgi:hypothetical protein
MAPYLRYSRCWRDLLYPLQPPPHKAPGRARNWHEGSPRELISKTVRCQGTEAYLVGELGWPLCCFPLLRPKQLGPSSDAYGTPSRPRAVSAMHSTLGPKIVLQLRNLENKGEVSVRLSRCRMRLLCTKGAGQSSHSAGGEGNPALASKPEIGGKVGCLLTSVQECVEQGPLSCWALQRHCPRQFSRSPEHRAIYVLHREGHN